MKRLIALLLLSTCVVASAANPSFAQETLPKDSWPQWGGVHRDHQSQATGLLQSWPDGGPSVAWEFSDAGVGYSSFSVLRGKLYTLGLIEGTNYLICVDATKGELIWRKPLGPEVSESAYNQGWAGGPRSTPTLAGDRVIAVDDGGILGCFNRHDGEKIWQVSMVDDLGGDIPKWGYSASPLVDGNRVVVCPGRDEFLVALDIETGKKVLASSGFSERAHYVSAMKHTVDGVDMYITAASAGLVAFSAETGEALWTNGSSGNGTATIPTPILKDNYVYHTSDYGTGCVLVDVSVSGGKVQGKEVYASKNMQNHHGGVLLLNDHIFGLKKGAGWVCHDLMSGEIAWTHRIGGESSAAVAYADNRIYVFGDGSGSCYLIEPSTEDWIEHGKLSLPEQTSIDRRRGKIWAHPVIAEGKLYLRDMDLIYAYDIRQ